jgi:hypothetical protein
MTLHRHRPAQALDTLKSCNRRPVPAALQGTPQNTVRLPLQPPAQPQSPSTSPKCSVSDGAPRLIRTADLRFRKPLLYPAELWALYYQ